MRTCKFCQKELTDKDEHCPFCGYDPKTDTCLPLQNQKIPKQPRPARSASIKSYVILVCEVLVLFGFIVAAFIFRDYLTSLPELVKKAFSPAPLKQSTSRVVSQGKKMDILKMVFREPSKEERQRNLFQLEGIFFDSAAASYCMVNGQVLKEGESLKGVRVIKIERDSVAVEVSGSRKTLGVSESIAAPL